jgi:hypothetical protein
MCHKNFLWRNISSKWDPRFITESNWGSRRPTCHKKFIGPHVIAAQIFSALALFRPSLVAFGRKQLGSQRFRFDPLVHGTSTTSMLKVGFSGMSFFLFSRATPGHWTVCLLTLEDTWAPRALLGRASCLRLDSKEKHASRAALDACDHVQWSRRVRVNMSGAVSSKERTVEPCTVFENSAAK